MPDTDTHIDTFLFDIGNVLVTFDFSKVVSFIEANSTADESTVQKEVEQRIVSLETGSIDGATFLAQLADTLHFSGDLDQLHLVYQDIFEPNQPMHQLVDTLCKNYRLVLFSNTSDLHKDSLFERYPVFSQFDGGVFSFISGSMKPDDGMYRDAIINHRIIPNRTLYLDDAPANIATGIRHGFHAIQYLPHQHERALAELAQLAPEIQSQ
ncbi:MAG: HAD family phosphatase [Verrucomicrobiales bacterium]